ncbi:MAG: ABC transporter ATP-binding protein [Phycisphaerae bacterium]|nr:ABC transporter ATP-binding protein [Phycisphaerae bacterium]
MNDVSHATQLATQAEAPLAVQARGLVKRYEGGRVVALDCLDMDVAPGEFVAICGPSGCGKSTLLNMLSAIDRPDAGSVAVCGRPLADLKDREADQFRASVVGLVFQLHNLLPNLTALENVQVPLMATRVSPAQRVERARELLDRVGLGDRETALPPVLSGGERQRVAIARALANRPQVLLADEPTGALDSKTGGRLFDLLGELRRDARTTLVVVTHDADIAGRAERVIHMLDGKIVDQADGED